MSFRAWSCLLVVIGLLGLGPAAYARQMGAREAPSVSGPLTQRTLKCERKAQREDGKVVVTAKSCIRLYLFSKGKETDPDRNYGVIWLQTNLNAGRGWCASIVKSDIDIPPKAIAHIRRPRSATRSSRKSFTTHLRVGARGKAVREGKIVNSFMLYPHTIDGRVAEDGNVFRVVWRGSTRRRLAFASGVEISWRGDPPGTISSGLRYRISKLASC